MREDAYFSAESRIRQVGRESVLVLGGGRALLMQAAHPLVAAGIVGHSSYRETPWRRLARTLTALHAVIYGTKAEADAVGAHVRSVHAGVRGRIREQMGPYAAGTPYDASDPKLQLWVHATLVDTGLVMYEMYVRPLSREEEEAFYQDMKIVAGVFGAPIEAIPETLADFWAYRRERLSSSEICVTDAAREVAEMVLDPPVPLALRAAFEAIKLTTVGLLPAELRRQYGFRWDRGHEALFAAATLTLRGMLLPLIPERVRLVDRVDRAGRPGGLPLQLLAALAQDRPRPPGPHRSNDPLSPPALR